MQMMGLYREITTKESNTWFSLEQFLMGLLEPNSIIDESLEVRYLGHFLLTHELFMQVEDCIKLLEQSNPPSIGNFCTKKNIADFLSNTLLQYNKSKNNSESTLISRWQLSRLLRHGLSKKWMPKKWIKLPLIEEINHNFIRNSYYNKHNYVKYISDILIENRLEISFSDFQEMLMKMEDSYEKSIFTHTFLTSETYSLNESFDVGDLLELLYRQITSQAHPFRNEDRFGEFTRKYTERYPRELLTYFAMKEKKPKVSVIYRLIRHFNEHAKYHEELQLNEEIWEFYRTVFIEWIVGMRRERHFLLFSKFLKKMGSSYRNEILDYYIKQLEGTNLSIVEREHYCHFMVWNVRKQDVNVILKI